MTWTLRLPSPGCRCRDCRAARARQKAARSKRYDGETPGSSVVVYTIAPEPDDNTEPNFMDTNNTTPSPSSIENPAPPTPADPEADFLASEDAYSDTIRRAADATIALADDMAQRDFAQAVHGHARSIWERVAAGMGGRVTGNEALRALYPDIAKEAWILAATTRSFLDGAEGGQPASAELLARQRALIRETEGQLS